MYSKVYYVCRRMHSAFQTNACTTFYIYSFITLQCNVYKSYIWALLLFFVSALCALHVCSNPFPLSLVLPSSLCPQSLPSLMHAKHQ